jgi:hypothetical protein
VRGPDIDPHGSAVVTPVALLHQIQVLKSTRRDFDQSCIRNLGCRVALLDELVSIVIGLRVDIRVCVILSALLAQWICRI